MGPAFCARFTHTLLVLIAAVALPIPAVAQSDLVRHAQPDGGSVSIPADWVIAQLAAEAMEGEEGARVQELISARGFYSATPVVMRSWRLSPAGSATLLVQGVKDELHSKGMQLQGLPPPAFTPPPGMRAKVDHFGYTMGSGTMLNLVVICEGRSVGTVLMLSWGSPIDAEFAPIRRQILEAWIPSKVFRETGSIARPEPMRTTVRFQTGEQAVVDDRWQVLGQDLEVKNLTVGATTMEHRRLLSLRRYFDPPFPTEILLLNRLGGSSGTGEAESMVAAEIQEVARTFGGQAQMSRRVVDRTVLELSSQQLPNGLHAVARLEQRGRMTLYTLGFVADPIEGMACARRLLASFSSSTPRQVAPQPPQASIAPKVDMATEADSRGTANNPPIARSAQSSAPPRGFSLRAFSEHLGQALGMGMFFALPALLAGIWSKQRAGWVLAFMVLVPGFFMSYGSIPTALNRIDAQDALSAEGPPEAGKRLEIMTRSNFGSWIFSLDTLGEQIFAENHDPLSVLACRCARGDRGLTLAALGALAVGSTFALLGPLIIRFVWIGRTFAQRRYAYLLGLAWFIFGVAMLSSLGSSSLPHRALVIGATLMTVLLLPGSKTAAMVGPSPPTEPPA